LDISLPYLISLETCNPLSIRMINKTSNSKLIDGGVVICNELDKDNDIKDSDQIANWLLTRDAIYYCYPQKEFIKEFSFFEWEINAHLSNSVKKMKKFHAIRLFEINKYETYNPQLFRRTLDNRKSSVKFYDFYVVNGKELNIATVQSFFKDQKGYQHEL